MSETAAPLSERFWRYVDRSTAPQECWPWAGATLGSGYGVLKHQGNQRGAHRCSWEIHHGPIPCGMHVLHRCDNPPCVNPTHLWLGTNADNVADKMRKGRHRCGTGETHGRPFLTEIEVRSLRARRSAGSTTRALAIEFGLSESGVRSIVTRRTWKHI